MAPLRLDKTMQSQAPVTAEIIDAIAAREQEDPLDLDVPLYDAVDIDAIEKLVAHRADSSVGNPISIEFTYLGYSVTVDEAGHVNIRAEPTTATADSPSAKGSTDD